jgi:hypothetical protein
MSEIAALVSICVEVDRAIADDPAARSRVAGVLPVDAAELDEAFRGSRAGRLDGMGEPSAVDEALARLADIPALGALATSRSLAIAALEQALPDYAAGGPKADLATRALRADAPAIGFPMPCTGQPTREGLVRSPVGVGNVDAVPRFRNTITCPDLSFHDAKLVLNPVNWLLYKDYWCGMEPQDAPDGGWHLVEHVLCGLDALTVEVCLEFGQVQHPDGPAILGYRMCQVEGHQPDDCKVTKDEGWICVGPAGGGVTITASKRVQFNDPIDVSPVVTACNLGYGDAAAALIEACCITHREQAIFKWEPVEVDDGL